MNAVSIPGKQDECGEQAAEAEEDLRAMSARARQAESRAREAQDELREMRLRAREAEHDARLAQDQVRELKEAKLSPALSVDSLSNAVCGGQGDSERLSRALDKVQVVLLPRCLCRAACRSSTLICGLRRGFRG
jgi:chromosome segregation ATPase